LAARLRHLQGMEFSNVTALAKANIYFDGRVVSHTIVSQDGSKRTLGLIYPGTYHFGTDAAECMQIVEGACSVALDGKDTCTAYGPGAEFHVPAKSGFTIRVEEGICQYVCAFLP
jgi:uncharacterized protein YaiE (UPF0345 family)